MSSLSRAADPIRVPIASRRRLGGPHGDHSRQFTRCPPGCHYWCRNHEVGFVDVKKDIASHIATSTSLGVFWMRTFFMSVPVSLLEAARVDGASRFGALIGIYLPIARPAVGTLAVLIFLFTWNEFLMPLVLVSQNPAAQTAPLSLSLFAGSQRTTDPAVTAAAAVIVAYPF